MTNRQRVFDLLAANPTLSLPTLDIVNRLHASHSSILHALCWLTLAKKVERLADRSTGLRGPHWQYRIIEGATRPNDDARTGNGRKLIIYG